MSSIHRIRELAEFLGLSNTFTLPRVLWDVKHAWASSTDGEVTKAAGRIGVRDEWVDFEQGLWVFSRRGTQKNWEPLDLHDNRFSLLRDEVERELETRALKDALDLVKQEQEEAIRLLAKIRLDRELAARRRS